MNASQTLLVYDDAGETAEVLKAVYQPRGFVVERVHSRTSSVTGALNSTVLVMNSERSDGSFDGHRFRKVLIGRLGVEERRSPGATDSDRTCRLPSLFEFRELVSAIDRLLTTGV